MKQYALNYINMYLFLLSSYFKIYTPLQFYFSESGFSLIDIQYIWSHLLIKYYFLAFFLCKIQVLIHIEYCSNGQFVYLYEWEITWNFITSLYILEYI